ncbi:DUF1499 domain-containing protein [Rhodoferax sp.]|uniref:DUF1499 domain-containing protein n=1 Tax=Rhodoferax sp. TaxID=50421 RepID=UPI00262BF5DE|nr:DUF1499 domain-containing protein [Rhodoferax sp.]MDD2924761.1 DUF1499 domain-containing protein [Rhodoferax sp.]
MSTPSKPLSIPAMAALVLSLGAITVIVASGLGYRLGWWHFTVGLQASEWAAYGAGLALVLSLVGLAESRPGAARRGWAAAVIGLLLALAPVSLAVQWEYTSRSYPAINDISTDTLDAPVFWDMPTPTDYPGAASAALQRAAYPDLVPLRLPLPPAKTFALALAVVKDKGWTVVASVPEEGRIEATASSLLYGFTDEVAIRVKPADGGVLVAVRSRSRLGKIDRGVNAKRIRAFLQTLKAQAA